MSFSRKLFVFLFTALLFGGLSLPVAWGESAARTELYSGKIDIFYPVPNGSSISLLRREQQGDKFYYYNPAQISLAIKESALRSLAAADSAAGVAGVASAASAAGKVVSLPAGVPERGYFVGSQLSAENPLQIGWDFSALAASAASSAAATSADQTASAVNSASASASEQGKATAVTLLFSEVSGPGEIYLWGADNKGGTAQNFLDSGYQLKAGAKITDRTSTTNRTSATTPNWLFTRPGTYQIRAVVEMEKNGQKLISAPAEFQWEIGKSAASAKRPSPSNAPAASAPAPAANNSAQPAAPVCRPVEVTKQKNNGFGGSHTIAANTHVHPNWVFTAPGTYRVGITQSARARSGAILRTTGTLVFQVGGAGNANSGHFDVGTLVQGSRLQMAIKDDRSQPAAWKSPQELVFGISGNARTTAPAGMEFVAAAGSPIWMIASTQQAGVPWVGANTQHPSLHGGTQGAVNWQITSFSGPGRMAVFESANFGKVGKVWFTGSPAGPQKVIVGRTASGEACQLSAEQIAQLQAAGKIIDPSALPPELRGLPQSGLPTFLLGVSAFLLAAAGVIVVFKRRSVPVRHS